MTTKLSLTEQRAQLRVQLDEVQRAIDTQQASDAVTEARALAERARGLLAESEKHDRDFQEQRQQAEREAREQRQAELSTLLTRAEAEYVAAVISGLAWIQAAKGPLTLAELAILQSEVRELSDLVIQPGTWLRIPDHITQSLRVLRREIGECRRALRDLDVGQ